MAVVTPAPRIGKTTGIRPRPADSEKLPRGAAFHVKSEVALGDVAKPSKRKTKRKIASKKSRGLINGGA